VQRYHLLLLAIKVITTIQLILITSKKMSLYTRHNMAHVVVFWAKMPFYILWRPNLWRFTKTPHMYKAAFIIDVVYKKKNATTYTIFCSGCFDVLKECFQDCSKNSFKEVVYCDVQLLLCYFCCVFWYHFSFSELLECFQFVSSWVFKSWSGWFLLGVI